MRRILLCSMFLATFSAAAFCAAYAPAQPLPVPFAQAIPQPHHQVSLERVGKEFARYHYSGDLRRPFLFPLIGPAGRSLTRMGHPHDPEGHSHHNSVWISHHDVNGVDFWGDRGAGRIVHRRMIRFDDGDAGASFVAANDWIDESAQRVLLHELRRVTFVPLENDQSLVVIDLKLSAAAGEVTLGKTPFGMLGVRMAKTIGVKDGGGEIRNSNGQVNEPEVFWKQARWVDYSGPIAREREEGITLLDHPANPNHPSVFHVRGDVWMGASLTHDGPRVVTADQPLTLRYGLWLHAGRPALEEIDARWKSFAELE
ncbi:MAG: PmoA family protein, partial [Planctomycetales bacterium]|nr:PmoA family protein [Planctomycetales bacterium]